jgi:hypothetical protein
MQFSAFGMHGTLPEAPTVAIVVHGSFFSVLLLLHALVEVVCAGKSASPVSHRACPSAVKQEAAADRGDAFWSTLPEFPCISPSGSWRLTVNMEYTGPHFLPTINGWGANAMPWRNGAEMCPEGQRDVRIYV